MEDKRSIEKRLEDAIYEVRFSQQAGVHDNGEPRKQLTVDQALDQICDRVGIRKVKPKPLFRVDWDTSRMYSRVSGNHYEVLYDHDDDRYMVKYRDVWYGGRTEDDIIDFIARMEREEPPMYAIGPVVVRPPWVLDE